MMTTLFWPPIPLLLETASSTCMVRCKRMGEESLSTNDGKPWKSTVGMWLSIRICREPSSFPSVASSVRRYPSPHRKHCDSLMCATLPLFQIGNTSTRCRRFIPGAALFFVEDSMTKVSTRESMNVIRSIRIFERWTCFTLRR